LKFITLFLLILLIGCTNKEDFSFPKEKDIEIKIPKYVLNKVQGGEIILRKGEGYLSNLIVDLLGENLNYSHAGIIIKDSLETYIIHSLSDDVSNIDGVQKCSIRDFLSDISDSALCIVKPVTDSLGLNRIQNITKLYLKLKIPFDHHFNMQTKNELHCIELVHDILLKALNKETLPVTKRVGIDALLFSNFFNSKNFKTVFELKPYSKNIN
jgi:hypothetical protein